MLKRTTGIKNYKNVVQKLIYWKSKIYLLKLLTIAKVFITKKLIPATNTHFLIRISFAAQCLRP